MSIPASSFRSSSIAAMVNCYANINVRLLCMTGLKDDACVYFPTGVCPVVPDIQFKDSQTFLDPSFTKGKQNDSSHTGILIQDLIGLCSQAPFGRDEKMVVDKTVRSCWQLDPEKFTICNTPTWNKAFEELKAAASGVLAAGLKPRKVELRLYKQPTGVQKGIIFSAT